MFQAASRVRAALRYPKTSFPKFFEGEALSADELHDLMDLHRALVRGEGFYEWLTEHLTRDGLAGDSAGIPTATESSRLALSTS
jgi:hypothetical protein